MDIVRTDWNYWQYCFLNPFNGTIFVPEEHKTLHLFYEYIQVHGHFCYVFLQFEVFYMLCGFDI